MRLARVLGAIGRALISAGVIVLLFVAYQLWGTGLQHQQAQGNLEDDFFELLDSDLADEARQIEATLSSAESDPAATGITAGEPGAEPADPSDPSAAADEVGDVAEAVAEPLPSIEDIDVSPEFLEALYPEAGDKLARIRIPAINVDQITVAGVSVEDLRKGPGHYPSTPNPGQPGNSAIAGHRTTYGQPFHRVDELQPGDEIIITTIQGTYTYLVKGNRDPNNPSGPLLGHFIVAPSDTWVLDQKEGENLLTLTACHPKFSARQRIIVQAELVGEPAPLIPRGEEVDLAPVQLDAGAEDEARSDERASEEVGEDIQQVMSDEVAADDDPSVDAEGNPIADPAADADGVPSDEVAAGVPASDESDPSATDPFTTDPAAGTEPATTAEIDEAEAVGSDSIELTAGQTPFDGETDFGEGLNGDPTKIGPAVMWGIAGGAIWMAAWFIGRRLSRKWTLYLIGIVPFTTVLWSCFVNIDQALPSY